jgi:hypothetical protein
MKMKSIGAFSKELGPKCPICNGKGKLKTLGGMSKDCKCITDPNYLKRLDKNEESIPPIDKRSKSYKEAIGKMVKMGMTKEEAEIEFEKEYARG